MSKSITLSYPQFPQYKIHIHKFTSVKNSPSLKSSLLAGEPSHDFAFINPAVIVSLEQLSAAVYRAILDLTGDRIRTRTLHSECILALSPTQNIVDALRRYGIQDDCTELVVIKCVEGNENYSLDIVEGEEVEVSDEEFQRTMDLQVVKKNYKLQSTDDIATMTRQIVGAMQLRGH